METTRQNKIARLLQKELSEHFRLQTQALHGVLISVSIVRISPDMSIARVYLSIFPSENAQAILKEINESSQTTRFDIAQKVRFQLRKMPSLIFYIDDSLDYLENIDNLLKQ